VPPLASSHVSLEIGDQESYRIAIGDAEPPDRPVPRGGVLVERAPGLFVVTTGAPERRVDVTLEEWPSEPPLSLDGGPLKKLVEVSAAVSGPPLMRVLSDDGAQALRMPLQDPAGGSFRIRLSVHRIGHFHAGHVLRLWPAPTAREWHYQLDEDGRPVARPDRSTTATLRVILSAEQANTLSMEAEEMAAIETENGDIDDIVEDCLQICDIVGYRTEPAGEVTVALTARQWKVTLAVLEHRGTVVGDPGRADVLRRAHDAIDTRIGNRLPPGRVFGL